MNVLVIALISAISWTFNQGGFLVGQDQENAKGVALYEDMASKAIQMTKPCNQDGKTVVGIQVGHWKSSELPDELKALRASTGTSAGGHNEWEVMLKLGQAIKADVEKDGVIVELLPATIPKSYCADLFLSLHADGNLDSSAKGYKAAAPWRDSAGGGGFVKIFDDIYGKVSNLPKEGTITRNMRGYYAFSSWRFQHAIDADTPAAILETGFLTNAADRDFLVKKTDVAAGAISESIRIFLKDRKV